MWREKDESFQILEAGQSNARQVLDGLLQVVRSPIWLGGGCAFRTSYSYSTKV